jgi:hypothetical protein
VPEERRESAKKYVKVATVVSIYAAIIGFMYFIDSFLSIDNSSSSVYNIIMLLMLIYMAFGFPSIGIRLVFMAKEKQPGASVPKHVHKPGF